MSWLDDLDRELRAVRMPARRRARIRAELDDHIRSDPASVDRLGEPADIARRFADEVGTSLSRRAAFAVFVALAPVGLLFGALFAALNASDVSSTATDAVGPVVILSTQVAFVGGMLALLRAWRLRHARTFTHADAAILVRRATLGLAGGVVTVASVAVAAAGTSSSADGFVPLAYITVAVGAVTLSLATVAVFRATRLQPVGTGPPAGDLRLDLGPLLPERLRGNPWRIAVTIAAAVGLCIALAGAAQSDPIDGLARGIVDALACIAGFALLGRWLGLRI